MKSKYGSRIIAAAYVFIGLALPGLIPMDIFEKAPFLDAFSTLIAGVVPNISHLSLNTEFPQIASLYLSVMWVFLVPLAVIFIKYPL